MSDNFRKKQYDQSAPIPAKFLMPDGSISDELPGGGGSETKKAYILSGPGRNRTSIKYDTFGRAVGDYTIVSMKLNGVLYNTAITPIQLHLEFEP